MIGLLALFDGSGAQAPCIEKVKGFDVEAMMRRMRELFRYELEEFIAVDTYTMAAHHVQRTRNDS